MRTFKQLKSEIDLIGPRGTKHFLGNQFKSNHLKYTNPEKVIVVRHFGGILNEKQVKTYFEIISELSNWVGKAKLSDIVSIVEPVELGIDFLSFPYQEHMYFRSTWELDGEAELQENQQGYQDALPIVKKALNTLSLTGNEQVLKGIVQRSILEVSFETYYCNVKRKVVVFEPIINVEDVMAWQLSSKIDN